MLKTGFKIYGILKDIQNLTSFNIEISISVKKNFIDFMVKIMSNDKCKANVNFLLYNRIYCFMYNIKTTEPELFSDLGMFYIDNF